MSGKSRTKVDYVIPEFRPLWVPDPTILTNGWGVCVREIGPDLAERMLRLNIETQRNLAPGTVARYAHDMESGNWYLTHQGIAFNAKGKLHDGQHRLHAVVESDCTIPFVIFFGVGSKNEMAATDAGKNRTATDAGIVLGREGVSSRTMATATSMMNFALPHEVSRGFSAWTTQDKLAFFKRHQSKILEATNMFSGGGLQKLLAKASMRAAVAAALYYHPAERVGEFVKIILDRGDKNETVPGSKSAIQLRIFYSTHAAKGLGGLIAQSEQFLRTATALQLFLSGEDRKKLFVVSENPFPINDPLIKRKEPEAA